MKTFKLLLILFLLNCTNSVPTINLPDELNETSGLEALGSELITFNDSGGEAKLYYLNQNGSIVYEREIIGASNIDWEDITLDSSFIYIADIGNNLDRRRDLSIIKVPIDKKDSSSFELIEFYYPEQVRFSTSYDSSQYDAEALISIKDSLYLFTKNKLKVLTEVYRLPKEAGTYKAEKIGIINTESIITSADYNTSTKLLAFTSTVDFTNYSLQTIENFDINRLTNFKINTNLIPVGRSQIEAVKIINLNSFWISSEDEASSSSARLFKLNLY